MGRQDLYQPLKLISERISTVIETGNEISVVTCLDPDGIASGSIALMTLSRMGARCVLRIVPSLNLEVIQEIKSEGRDFYMILGLGSKMVDLLFRLFGENWVVIDHRELAETSEDSTHRDYDSQIINAWKYGLDGEREISAGGLCYTLATVLDKRNQDLSALAVIAALGDRQDSGEKRALVGMNHEILKKAQSLHLVEVELDLLINAREMVPLHESLSLTSYPYIHGLTWNVQNAYSIIENTGIKMKDNDAWRVLSDFTPEEKNIVRDAIAKYIITTTNTKSAEIADNLLGYNYRLSREDARSILKDAREFGTLLEACGLLDKAGIGVALCIGDRSKALTEAEQLIENYSSTLKRSISAIFNDKWRYLDDGKHTVFVNGEGLISEGMLGTVSTILSGSPSLFGRFLFIRTLNQEDRGNSYTFSARKCVGSTSQLNVGDLINECSIGVGGNGGGNDNNAVCSIPSSKLDIFMSNARSVIANSKVAESSTKTS
jgi:single-stranded-DNA-specific exonuclease